MASWLRMPGPAAEFVAQLSAAPKLPRVYNPWREPALVENLCAYLESWQHWPGRVPILVVGEALGYLGGRHAGIPFSSAALYGEVPHPFLQTLQPKLQISAEHREVTADIVWRYLQGKPNLPLFWNGFPFHPHHKYRPRSNRKPSVRELRRGVRYLQALADWVQPERVAGLGRVGQQVAQWAFPEREIVYIRHPSYGGKQDFLTGMEQLL